MFCATSEVPCAACSTLLAISWVAAPCSATAAETAVLCLIDSGFREAADAVKALALGAQAVLLGRVVLYGLAAGGEAGATAVLEMLAADLDRTLALLGAPSVAALDRSIVALRG
ncbi:MAG: alpha-hydroxy-acid oxidizing protein [Rhodospirillaceae bacterium]